MTLSIEVLSGEHCRKVLPQLAELRVTVFADYPYLYDGSVDYEARYLETFLSSEHAVIVGAFDDDVLVGAATGSPLNDHHDDFAAAFDETGFDLENLFYCAESVLLPAYRGRGIGHRFFDERERHAKGLGFSHSCFCAVVRPDDHPSRPQGYETLERFWKKRGYEKLNGALATFSWKEHGESEESAKPMQFWIRGLGSGFGELSHG